VVAGRRRLDDGRLARRVDAGEQHGGLHLRARHRQLVRQPAQGLDALDHERRVAFRRHDVRAHPAQRLGDAFHRARAQRLVARQLEAAGLAGDDPGEQPHQRPGVGTVDGPRAEPTQSRAVDEELVVRDLIDAHAERTRGRDGRLGVGRAPEAAHAGLPVADRAEEHRPVRDRLVARYGDVPGEVSSGL